MNDVFAANEFATRWERAQHAMADVGLDALWIGTEANFVYFTGVATPSFVSRSRPISLLLPAGRPPVIVIARNHVAHIRQTTTVLDVRGFDGFEPAAIAALVDTIRDLGLERGRIGCELGDEFRLPMTYLGFEELKQRLPDTAWSDASKLVWAARKLKSPAEIAVLKEVGRMTGAAFEAMFSAVRPGATQRDLFSEFSAAAARTGADRVGYFSIHNGTGADRRSNASPSDQALLGGDLIWVDAGLIYHGYWSDFTRMAVIGDADPKRRAEYRFVHDVSRELMATIHPGVVAEEVMAWCKGAFERSGRTIGNATRIGHGLGLDITEPPSIVAGDQTVLVPNMTLAIEPGVASDLGYFVVEENFVLGPDEVDLLSPPAPDELPSIA